MRVEKTKPEKKRARLPFWCGLRKVGVRARIEEVRPVRESWGMGGFMLVFSFLSMGELRSYRYPVCDP